MYKKSVLGALVLGAGALSPVAHAEVSANFGFMSDYLFRGIYQSSSSAYTGIDLSSGGFYAGTWIADVDDGVEADVYGGYGWEFESGFTLGIGATGYFYSDEFDETYTEANLNLGYKFVSVEFASGTYDSKPQEADYTFGAITIGDKAYVKFGSFGGDFEGSYGELGYGKDVGDLSFGIALVFPNDELDLRANAQAVAEALAADPTVDLTTVSDEDVYLTFDISYSFDL